MVHVASYATNLTTFWIYNFNSGSRSGARRSKVTTLKFTSSPLKYKIYYRISEIKLATQLSTATAAIATIASYTASYYFYTHQILKSNKLKLIQKN